MRVLIIGAGAIGVAMGTFLRSQDVEVDFIARGETAKAIREKGIHRTGLFGEYDAQAGCFEHYKELPESSYDYVIVSTKTMANESISEELSKVAHIFKKNGKIVIMQNGWGTAMPYLKYFPKEQVYNARVITGFQRVEANISNITVHTAPVLLGSLCGEDPSCMEPLQKALNAGGIPTEVSTEIGKFLWAKMLYNTTLNPLGAILGVNYGKLMESPASKSIMDQLIVETFQVMDAYGYETNWKTAEEYQEVFYQKLIPDTYNHRASTLQDIEKKQKTEIDTLNGCIVELAKEKGISVPTHEMIVKLIKSLEDNF